MTTMEQVEATLARIAEQQERANLSNEAFKNQLAASQEAADRRNAEAEQRSQALDHQIKELGKQIGGLGNKFNRFTDELGLRSIGKFLFKRFAVEDFIPRRYRRFEGEFIEFGALGIVNGNRNEAYIVEIKSHLRSDALEQMRSTLGRFRSIFTEYRQMKLYGVIVAGDASAEALHEARQAGFYVISFDNNIMHFHDGDGFVPKAY